MRGIASGLRREFRRAADEMMKARFFLPARLLL
jgi:hypothetical protein